MAPPADNSDFKQAAKKLTDAARRIRSNTDQALRQQMQRMAVRARAQLQADGNPAVWRGRLLKSIDHTENPDVAGGVGQVNAHSTHAVQASAPYAAYVEYGTGNRQAGTPPSGRQFKAPSVPPLTPIRRWVRTSPKVQVRDDKTIEQTARDISESIANMGQHAQPYMRPAWHTQRESLKAAHHRAVKKAVHRAMRG